MTEPENTRQAPELSVVIAARDEVANIAPLVAEIDHVLSKLGLDHEVVIVDDGSRDGTGDQIRVAMRDYPSVRGLALACDESGRGQGQSAAIHAGLRAARGSVVATMDADLQNDPGDLPRLLELLASESADMVQGDRGPARRDPVSRRVAAAIGRASRRLVLGDTIRDTGCTLRVFWRDLGRDLPLQYAGMHRFVPHLARAAGYVVIEARVTHRPRHSGRPKYGSFDRGPGALRDLLAVRWMTDRLRGTDGAEIAKEDEEVS